MSKIISLLKHKKQRKQIVNFVDYISEKIYEEFLNNPNADVSKYEKIIRRENEK